MKLKYFLLILFAFQLIAIQCYSQTFNLPYQSNFDSVSIGWTSIPSTIGNTSWQLGSPNFGTTNSPFSSPNSWDINLVSAYEANAECYLISPFFDFAGNAQTILKFWQNRNVQNNWDGSRLEFSLDLGTSWQILGMVGSAGSVNWYNNPSLIASGLPGWTGQSGGMIGSSIWQKSEIPLPDFSTNPNPVQFRFVFNSSPSVQFDGMSIDDFSIEVISNIDIGILNLSYPNPALIGDTIPILVQLVNLGNQNQDSILICYNVNGGTPFCSWYLINLLPGDTSQPILIGNLIIPSGLSTICTWINVNNDSNPNNDILCGQITGETIIPISFGNDFFDNFDGSNFGWTTESTNGQWQFGSPAGIAINFPHSSPNVWTTLLTANYYNNSNDNLISPPFDFTNALNARMSFFNWTHSETNWDGGRIDYTTDNGNTWQVLGAVNDPKGTNWYNNSSLISSSLPGWNGLSSGWIKSEYKLDQFNNYPDPVKFRFNFSSDASVNSFDGWAIDDFKIEIPITVNALTKSIDAGGPIILPGNRSISANIVNGGSVDLSSVEITLEIDGNIIVTDLRNFSPPLPFNNSVKHTFSIPWNAVSGCSDIRVWTSNPNSNIDLQPADDTSNATFCVFETISSFPYCNNFESGNQWTAYNSKNPVSAQSWELGNPTQALINNAFSGNNAWMTKLDQNYPNEDASVLLTPGFNVSFNSCYRFSFEGNFITEQLLDGGSIDFSYDDGATWIPFGDTSNANWYNTYNIFSFGTIFPKPGWSGTSNGWQHYEKFHIGQTSGIVIFRFWFVSDLTITNEGWAIDDFCFEELLPNCVTAIEEQESIKWQNLYPNPTKDLIYLEFEIMQSEKINISISNVIGNTVYQSPSLNYNSGKQSLEIDTKDFEAGIYFITLSNEDYSIIKKFIVIN